ncbi:MAG: hypothetical protein K8R23_11285 [Chthoniobacter sp.]|nr:hypothetical protein [Chthoniobacter sp.]
MNGDQTKGFAEQASTWLFGIEFVVYVAAGVVLLFYQFPAYKQFRTPALLLIVISCAFGLFVTIFDHTIGQQGPPDPNDWWSYYLVRELTWLGSVILGTVGSVMFLRDYIRLATATSAATLPSSTPTGTPPKSQ